MKDRKQQFIERAKEIHAGENLDYSEVVYVNNRTPVKIIDHDLKPDGTEYGEFWQTPSNHLKGHRHPEKRASRISSSKRYNQDEVIKKFREVHSGENLDYSEVKYVNMHTKVKIISHDLRPDGTEYGEFWQEPAVHLKGCSHPEIGIERQRAKNSYNTETFIELAKKVHGDKYLYDKVKYEKSQVKVCITCKEHGDFWINPDSFLQGKGCPVCGNHISHAEEEIAASISNLIGEENVVTRDRTVLDGKEIDIYLPKYGVGIEFDGLKWHSDEFNKDRYYHITKSSEAAAKGVRLIHVFEDEYLTRKELVIDKILNIIGLNSNKPRIYARNCSIEIVCDNKVVTSFLEHNHIQGATKYTVAFGAYNNGSLVAIMTFIKIGNEWTLNRFCTDVSYLCPGVASKIFKRFINEYSPEYVKSFLDRRWCFSADNNLYTVLGFSLEDTLKPDYRYTNGHGERKHKFGFRKQLVNKKYGLPITMTESEMTSQLGYHKIWDCGLFKYVWKKQ